MNSLLDFSPIEISELTTSLGQPKYRASQLFKWLHEGVGFDDMSNLPKSFLAELSQDYTAQGVNIFKKLTSKDGTIKYLYLLNDGNIVEGVLMRYKYGNTLCVSTQVGCRMNCAFCASGLGGLIRNLTAGEILGQVVAVNRDQGGSIAKRAITNIVLMGSGEPLDNYAEVTKFLRLVNCKEGINISERNISLSTSGLADGMRALADDGFSITLTVSLHAPNDAIRSLIMPINRAINIQKVLEAAKYYFDKTGRRIIFEYALIGGVNDSAEQALELASLLKGYVCHVNLIRLNEVKERGLSASKNDKVFLNILSKEGVSVTVRRTMGDDIEGACGQLRRKFLNEG